MTLPFEHLSAITVDVEFDARVPGQNSDYLLKSLSKLLQLLKEERIKATFFCLGQVVESFPQNISRIVDEGHEIGCHSFSHKRLTRLPLEELNRTIGKATNIIKDVVGVRPLGFRAPQYCINESTIMILKRHGYVYDSSIVPTKSFFGRYNYLGYPQSPFHICTNDKKYSILEIPVSVLDVTRIPLSLTWMQFLGYRLFMSFFKLPLNGSPLVFYMHCYEITEVSYNESIRLPTYYKLSRVFYRNTGMKSFEMLRKFIRRIKSNHSTLVQCSEIAKKYEKLNLKKIIINKRGPSSVSMIG